jgi:hypothetical protein
MTRMGMPSTDHAKTLQVLASTTKLHNQVAMWKVGGAILAAVSAAFLSHSAAQQLDVLPAKITIFVDASLPVPFAVVPALQPVKAGSEVLVRSVQGDKVKIAYGVGEGLVDISSTDFIKQAEAARAAAAKIRASATPTPPQVVQRSPAYVTSWANADNRLDAASETQDKQRELMRNEVLHGIRQSERKLQELDEQYSSGMRELGIARRKLEGAFRFGDVSPSDFKNGMQRLADDERDLARTRDRVKESLQHDIRQRQEMLRIR